MHPQVAKASGPIKCTLRTWNVCTYSQWPWDRGPPNKLGKCGGLLCNRNCAGSEDIGAGFKFGFLHFLQPGLWANHAVWGFFNCLICQRELKPQPADMHSAWSEATYTRHAAWRLHSPSLSWCLDTHYHTARVHLSQSASKCLRNAKLRTETGGDRQVGTQTQGWARLMGKGKTQ